MFLFVSSFVFFPITSVLSCVCVFFVILAIVPSHYLFDICVVSLLFLCCHLCCFSVTLSFVSFFCSMQRCSGSVAACSVAAAALQRAALQRCSDAYVT